MSYLKVILVLIITYISSTIIALFLTNVPFLSIPSQTFGTLNRIGEAVYTVIFVSIFIVLLRILGVIKKPN